MKTRGRNRFEEWKYMILFAAALFVPSVHASTLVSKVRYSPDTTISLGGTVVSPQNEAEELIASAAVSVLAVPAIAGAEIDGYAVASNGDHLISYDTAVSLSGITFEPHDIIRYGGAAYSMEFDGSLRGLSSGTNVTDFAASGTSLYFVLDTATSVSSISAGPQDVLRFDGSNLVLHFDGAINGLPAGVAIDALHVLPNGHLLLSFDVSGTVGSVTFDDDDVVEHTAAGNIFELVYNGGSRFAAWDSADLRALSACGGATISSSSANVAGTGGSGSVAVAPGNGCDWTAATNDGFITFTPAAGTGVGSVSYTVAVNPTCAPRQGSVTVAGNTFTISQAAGTGTFSVNPTQAAVAGSGGTGDVAVTATAGCAWSATSNHAFITITTGPSGNGNGTVSYSVAANPTCGARQGSLTIAGHTFTISQAAGAGTFSISPTQAAVAAGGGTGDVAVTATAGCAWSATSNDAFISITSGSSGIGNGAVSYSVAANTSSTPRSGTLSVAGQTFTVNQAGITGLRGDANGDGVVTVADVFYIVNFLFAAGPPPIGVADANADNAVTVSDVFYLVNYLFAGGPVPPPL